jgi:K+-transporting ATPase ATPase B chain
MREPLTLGAFVGAVFMTSLWFATAISVVDSAGRSTLLLAIAAGLWTTLLLSGFAEALDGRLRLARSATLRSTHRHVHAKRLLGRNRHDYHLVEAGALRRGDLVLVEANEVIPADGTVIEGAASVSEGAVTGESAPVLRAALRDCSSVRSGTRVLSDWLVVRVRSREGFFDPMVPLPDSTWRLRTGRETLLCVLLAAATILFLLSIATLAPLSRSASANRGGVLEFSLLVMLVVCATSTLTRSLLSVLRRVGVHNLMRANVIVTSGAAVETAGIVDIMVIDKTGTITLGDRRAVAFHAAPGITDRNLLEVAQIASLADATPEGRSIVVLARQLLPSCRAALFSSADSIHKFSAQTCISGVDREGRSLRKGAAFAVRDFIEDLGGSWPDAVSEMVDKVARSGATPIVVADGARVLGVVELRDVVKSGVREACVALRHMAVRTVLVTGDNHLTAMAMAADLGVDDFLGEATPDKKLELVRSAQKDGNLVAMCGDGANDAPALSQADLAIVMNAGTTMAKDVGDMVDLDSNPTKFIDIIKTGRLMIRKRRLLTAFSIATDLAKYFAIAGACLAAGFPQLQALNVMRLTSPYSAMMSAVIVGALLVVIQVQLAYAGLRRLPPRTDVPRFRNLLLYGSGVALLALVCIKAIDTGLVNAHLV